VLGSQLHSTSDLFSLDKVGKVPSKGFSWKPQVLFNVSTNKKSVFEQPKQKVKNETSFWQHFQQIFIFVQLAVNRVQDQPQLLTLFMAAMS